MAARKHDDFLGTTDSDDDGSQGYDSEAETFRKGDRQFKKRRLDQSDIDEEDEAQDDNLASEDGDDIGDDDEEDVQAEGDDGEAPKRKMRQSSELPGVSTPLSKKNLIATAAAIKKSGVVYLSRVPPFMKPQKLRSLLEPYGTINRIFLTPEDPTSHTRRVRNGGNKKRSYTDGWVEFVNKANAKHACELLNAKTIGGKKGTYYRDDVWTLLYLKGFKWSHLTAEIAAADAERASRMRAEISKTTKENREFVLNVEKAKKLEGMEAKRAAKVKHDDDENGDKRTKDDVSTKQKKGKDRAMQFKQNAAATKKKNTDMQPEAVKRVLSKIF